MRLSCALNHLLTYLLIYISLAVLTYDENGDVNTPRVYSSFGQRWCLDPTPGTVSLGSLEAGITVASTFKRHLKAELFSRTYGVSLTLQLGYFRALCFVTLCYAFTLLTVFILYVYYCKRRRPFV